MTRVGVLALQGDFLAHQAALGELGVSTARVRKVTELDHLDGIVLPGGESSVMLRLLRFAQMHEALHDVIAGGLPVLGTCAGLILLAKQVENPQQDSLDLLDATVSRNAYGPQYHSGVFPLEGHLGMPDCTGIFIRAPRITHIGAGVEVLASRDGDPVFVRQGTILAAAFHPELDGHHPVLDIFLHALEQPREARNGLQATHP
ncbi:MAG: pyridoxal 5'-phosphate synthase glutaminase subunit PdxT [Planctomycetes bacterium]|nr:pyridoxal 5'-phosphate synthase glutaminase subunit PdxT [Planctomycetota bacterium]MCB9891285.1 pyridoxal 5'-phosphate synthase glutaminase subunit PdxT [Planctomycetota bacterium]MCB9919456.1 pyridoxal 5'-phosphate synthase glutaminase subunit PdxT [Planctomycetota bacterium]